MSTFSCLRLCICKNYNKLKTIFFYFIDSSCKRKEPQNSYVNLNCLLSCICVQHKIYFYQIFIWLSYNHCLPSFCEVIFSVPSIIGDTFCPYLICSLFFLLILFFIQVCCRIALSSFLLLWWPFSPRFQVTDVYWEEVIELFSFHHSFYVNIYLIYIYTCAYQFVFPCVTYADLSVFANVLLFCMMKTCYATFD